MSRNYHSGSRRNGDRRNRSNTPNNYGYRSAYDPHSSVGNNNRSYYGPQLSVGTQGFSNYSQNERNQWPQNSFQTPVSGVSPFLIRQLQSNNPTNPFTINQNQQIQQSGSNLAAQEPQNNYRINSTGMAK